MPSATTTTTTEGGTAEQSRTLDALSEHAPTIDGIWADDVAVGDVLATPVTGAYGHSMASNYNKVPRPPVLFVKERAVASRRAPGNAGRPPPPGPLSWDL